MKATRGHDLSPEGQERHTVKKMLMIGATIVLIGGVVVGSGSTPASAAIVSATCENNVNDDNVIQAAIDGSSKKDIIQIHGQCLFDQTVKLVDNRTYEGDGKGSTQIVMAPGSNLKALLATSTWLDNSEYTNSGITIRHLNFDGNADNNKATPPGSAVIQFRAWDSTLEDFEIWAAPRDAVRISSLTADGTTSLAGTSVNSTVKDFAIYDTGETPINVVDPGNSLTDWNLMEGWVAGSGGGFSGVNLDNAAGWEVRNLHLYGIAGTAISANRCFGTRILENYIEDFGNQGKTNGAYSGIYCHMQGDAASVVANNTVNLFQGTLGSGTTYRFIDLEGNYGRPLASVTGNSVRGHGTTREIGLAYRKGGAAAMTVASTGNAVTGVGTARSVESGVTVSTGS